MYPDAAFGVAGVEMEAGFIGTGNMGNPMAGNMLKAGNSLIVHDAKDAAAANLLELGGKWADSPRAVAEQTGVIFFSLPGPPEIEAVLTGANGVLAGAKPGSIVFDLSTQGPATAKRMAAVAAERGVTYLDAPVSGGVGGARAGTLAVMVGGDRAAFDAYKPLLDAIGTNVFHMGEVGAGSTVKLMNNLIALAVQPLIQEAVITGIKAGIAPEKLYEVMSVSSAQNVVRGLPRMLEHDFDTIQFALALANKDVGLAVQLGRELGVPMPVASAAHAVYQWAMGKGYGVKNTGATMLLYEEATGAEARANIPT